MRQRRLSILALAACIGFACAVHAAPTQFSASAGEIRDIRYASGAGGTAVMWAASQGGGVFKSTTGGSTWTKTGLSAGYAWKVAPSVISPTTTAYAATEEGLFKTTNANTATPTWTQLTFDPVRTVAVDPTSAGSDTILIGVRGSGVLQSTNGGTTWTRQSGGLAGLQSVEPTHIVFHTGTSTAYVVLACNYEDVDPPLQQGNWGRILRTANAKADPIVWTDFMDGGGAGATLTTSCIGAIDANATSVWVGLNDPFDASQGKIYRSQGAGWVAGTQTIPSNGNFFVGINSIAVDRTTANTVHVGTATIGMWTSSDNGLNFNRKVNPVGADKENYTRINAIETIPGTANTLVIAPRGIGISRATAAGNDPPWTPATGVYADRVRGLDNHAAAAPLTYWMALEQGGVFKTTNVNTNTWNIFIEGMDLGGPLGGTDMLLSATALAADASDVNTVLVGTRGAGLLRLNAGTSWTQSGLPASVQATAGPIQQPEHLLIPSSGKVYYTMFNAPGGAAAGGLMQSTSGAGNLVQTAVPEGIVGCNNPSPGASASGYKVVQTPSGIAYLIRYDGLPYRSTNGFTANNAACVTAPQLGTDRLHFWGIAERPGQSNMVVGSTNKGVFRSTDGGVNFARVDVTGLPTQVLADVAYNASGILYGITRGGTAHCSTDNGATWTSINLGGLPAASFQEIRVISGAIHVLTDGAGFYVLDQTCP